MTAEMLSELEERTSTLAESDLASVQAMVEELESAWNEGDGARFAQSFAEDADFIDIHGVHVRGRGAIAACHETIFRTVYAGSRVVYRLDSLRVLGDRGAAALLRARLYLASSGRTLEARPLLVLARRRGRWRIAAFHNTLVTRPAAASPMEE